MPDLSETETVGRGDEEGHVSHFHPFEQTTDAGCVLDTNMSNLHDAKVNALKGEHVVTESEKVIAKFCVEAPTVEIRDCLRQYAKTKSYDQLSKSFNIFPKKIIADTLHFLGVSKEWDSYLKNSCVRELIYRIQSLLPEECNICNQSYTIQKNDPPLLSCSICLQEVHRKCYLPILQARSLINTSDYTVLDIPGFHYFCSWCEKDLIPNNDTGLKKKKKGNTIEIGHSAVLPDLPVIPSFSVIV